MNIIYNIITVVNGRGGDDHNDGKHNNDTVNTSTTLSRQRLLRGDGDRTVVMWRATADERAVRNRRGY